MPAIRTLLRSLTVCALTLPGASFAADPITGVVTNKTTNKPSAGDDVVLIRLQQGMQESTRTRTDARGHYKLDVPDDGLHLVRVTHDKANYFHPATPGTQSVDLDVYNAAPKIEGVTTSVQELHIEATSDTLHVVEILQILNRSAPPRTQFGPAGFDFYLPADAHIERTAAITDGGMPVPAAAVPVGDPGHYTFLFPIRPGETQFGIFYSVPYSGKLVLSPKLVTPVTSFAVVLPRSMKLEPGRSAPYALQPEDGKAQTYLAQNVSPSQPLDFTVTGVGQLPHDDPNAGQGPQQPSGADSGQVLPETENKMPGRGLQNPLDPEGTRDPWAKYKWWILGGLALLLTAAAGALLRKPSGAAPVAANPLPPTPATPQTRNALVLQTLKEELFALETDRLQNLIGEKDYAEQRAALELVLRRALNRTQASAPGSL